MIFYLVTGPNLYTTTAYFKSWGKHLAAQIQLMFYEQLPVTKQLPIGTYIFADIERLDPEEAEAAARVWESLASSSHNLRLLNHPTRSMRRYELLRTLYDQGINKFNIYRLTEGRGPESFPVFIRRENDHGGNLTPLLHTAEELQAAIKTLDQQGQSRQDKIIVEFCDTVDADGHYRKYSAFIVGDQIIPTHIFYSTGWMAKGEKLLDEVMLREERQFVEENPHEQALREIFRLAQIDYGRIDYALLDGEIQVWEINTNPMMPRLNYGGEARRPVLEHSTERINAALTAINYTGDPNVVVNNRVYQNLPKRIGKLLLQSVPHKYRPFVRRGVLDVFKTVERSKPFQSLPYNLRRKLSVRGR